MGAARLFGYDAAEMQGQGIERLFTAEDRAREMPKAELQIARDSGRTEDDRWMLRKDGLRFWASGAVTCMKDARGEPLGYAKLLRDRTDVKAELEALRARGEALQKGERIRDRLLGTLAHELRNPLGVLANAVQLLRSPHAGEAASAMAKQMLERQVKYLGTLIENILESARLAAGKVALELAPLDLGNVLHEALESCAAALRERQQSAQVLLPPTPIRLEGDATRLRQVFVNLIANASKFSEPGRTIRIKALPEGESAVVRVEDEGQGIAPDLLPKVFDLFTQPGARAHGSLGLGLGIVKEYVELHGGSVAVRSEGLDRGSQFIVRIPLAQRPDP